MGGCHHHLRCQPAQLLARRPPQSGFSCHLSVEHVLLRGVIESCRMHLYASMCSARRRPCRWMTASMGLRAGPTRPVRILSTFVRMIQSVWCLRNLCEAYSTIASYRIIYAASQCFRQASAGASSARAPAALRLATQLGNHGLAHARAASLPLEFSGQAGASWSPQQGRRGAQSFRQQQHRQLSSALALQSAHRHSCCRCVSRQ